MHLCPNESQACKLPLEQQKLSQGSPIPGDTDMHEHNPLTDVLGREMFLSC